MANSYLDKTGLQYFNTLLSNKINERLPYYAKTTAEWNSSSPTVSERGVMYVYTDHKTITRPNGSTVAVPGIKMGDGLAYVVDLPFINIDEESFLAHVGDTTSHITNEERQFWNEKVRCFISPSNNENLIFTTN